jgi:hypothetical protein
MDIKKYIIEKYKATKVGDISDHNDYYDYVAIVNNRPLTIELKERTVNYDDILLEAIQTSSIFCDAKNNLFDINPHNIHVAIGWFYKCEADRLIYCMPNFIYDFDWPKLKEFILTNFNLVELQYSDKTTGTINYKIKINLIPVTIYSKLAV